MTSIADTVMAAVAATVAPAGGQRRVPASAPVLGSSGQKTSHGGGSLHQVEAYLQAHERSVKFAVDRQTGLTIVTVMNETTGERVRQIPSEVTVRIAQYFDAMQAGQNVDEVA